jgi:hypothetical protein
MGVLIAFLEDHEKRVDIQGLKAQNNASSERLLFITPLQLVTRGGAAR